jgi:hypothetical protein
LIIDISYHHEYFSERAFASTKENLKKELSENPKNFSLKIFGIGTHPYIWSAIPEYNTTVGQCQFSPFI